MYVFIYVIGVYSWRSLFTLISRFLNIYLIAIVDTFALIKANERTVFGNRVSDTNLHYCLIVSTCKPLLLN
jgi:hypothetical protein